MRQKFRTTAIFLCIFRVARIMRGSKKRIVTIIMAMLAAVLAACSLVLLGILRRFCLHRRMWPILLYAGSGLALLTLLNLWNATWVG